MSFSQYFFKHPLFIFVSLVGSFAFLAIMIEILVCLAVISEKFLILTLIFESVGIIFTPKMLTFKTNSRFISDCLTTGVILLGLYLDSFLNPLFQILTTLNTYFIIGSLCIGILLNHIVKISLILKYENQKEVIKKW